jgi:VWFA-related protein
MKRLLIAILLAASAGRPATKLEVSVVDPKTGKVVAGLNAADFTVLDDRTPRQVEAAEFAVTPIDVMLLLDTSLVGEMVQPVADTLIAQVGEKEQMAIVSYHSSADLIQDFTSSRELLRRAVVGVKYGNMPQVLDALYAAIDGGFDHATMRRVILVLTTGYEGDSRVDQRQVLRMARRNGVSISTVYVSGAERSMFEALARQTGGACFNLRDLRKVAKEPPGKQIFEVLRSRYTLSITGNLSIGEKLKVEVKRPGKLFVSALAVE